MLIASFALTILVGFSRGQQQQQHVPSLSPYQTGSQLQTATTPKPYYPPAQVHYVNIGEDLAGDYKFGYDTGKNGAGQSFREETRLPDGTVKGAYGYIDAEGKQRIVKYSAGIEGFKVESDEEAPGQATGTAARNAAAAAAPVVRTYSPPPPPPPRQASPLVTAAQPQQQLSPITITRGDPQTLTIRSVASGQQLQPISIRTYVAANDTSYATTNNGQSSIYSAATPISASGSPAYRIITSPGSSSSAASAYPGYTTVAQTTGMSQPQYMSQSPNLAAGGTNQYSSPSSSSSSAAAAAAYQQPTVITRTASSPATAMTLSALLAQVARSSPNLSSVGGGGGGNTQQLSSLLRQAPATAYSGSPFSSASIYGNQPASLASAAAQPQPEQEATTWGPPVINKELLSYNIGVQQG
ncbi:hypothetical protein HUG17_2788 [Dermatophagoides farinae]|uniref:Uncharacterized protein n=1 Tax=Dermatophagoides farinae TaxID=6954 RepID=A0A9D4SF60_DERFA|nr:hypothetical protein HUG17_2788 [Dermatophagoides farinae]